MWGPVGCAFLTSRYNKCIEETVVFDICIAKRLNKIRRVLYQRKVRSVPLCLGFVAETTSRARGAIIVQQAWYGQGLCTEPRRPGRVFSPAYWLGVGRVHNENGNHRFWQLRPGETSNNKKDKRHDEDKVIVI